MYDRRNLSERQAAAGTAAAAEADAAATRDAASQTYASRLEDRTATAQAEGAQAAAARPVAAPQPMAPIAPLPVIAPAQGGQALNKMFAGEGVAENSMGNVIPFQTAASRFAAAGGAAAVRQSPGTMAADVHLPYGMQAPMSEQGRTMAESLGAGVGAEMTPEEKAAAVEAGNLSDTQGRIDDEWAAINERMGAGLNDSLGGMRANTSMQQRRAAEVNAMMGGGVGGGFGATMANLGAQGALGEGQIRADYANKVVQTKMAYLDRLMADAQRAQDRSLTERISNMQAELQREMAELGYASDAESSQAMLDAARLGQQDEAASDAAGQARVDAAVKANMWG